MMKIKLNVQRCAELAVAMTAIAALIAGCGGGGSSSGTGTTSLSGTVADGYLSGVKVCLDKNSNSVCDSGEPYATTGASGAFSIAGVTSSDIANYPLVAEVPAGAVDEDTASAVGQAFVLTSPAGTKFVSPLTSIFHQMMKDNPSSSVAAIKTQLVSDMSLSSSIDPLADYVADAASSTSATSGVSATAHKFAKVVANSMMINYSVASGVSDSQKGALQGTLVKLAKLAAQSEGASVNPSTGTIGIEDNNTLRAVIATQLTTGTASQSVTVNFDVVNGSTSVKACDSVTLASTTRWDQTALPGAAATLLSSPVAGPTTTGKMKDIRFYISNVLLWDASGNAVPLVMDESPSGTVAADGAQSKNVALLNFGHSTNGTYATCADSSASLKTSITGKVVPGTYTGVSFTLGVPARSADFSTKLNHTLYSDTSNPLPMQVGDMAWNWQGGRKFFKLDIMPSTPATKFVSAGTTGTVPVINTHIGSTGCQGNPASVTGIETACTNPNKLSVKFDGFDTTSNTVVLSLDALFGGSDLTYEGGGAAGCMSGTTDPECAPIFNALGIGLTGANAGRTLGTQTVFTKR
jgi:uncharacterized repeat protein (TIGR04052 family)